MKNMKKNPQKMQKSQKTLHRLGFFLQNRKKWKMEIFACHNF